MARDFGHPWKSAETKKHRKTAGAEHSRRFVARRGLRRLATGTTGNYDLELRGDGLEQFVVWVRFTGAYSGGGWSHVWLEFDDPEDATNAMARRWFAGIRGDRDVEQMLADAGFDDVGNPSGRPGAHRVGYVRDRRRARRR